MLLVATCAPYFFTFCDSAGKCMFGNRPWPTLRVAALCLFIESLHTFGVSIFVFRVLPKLDMSRAILIMNAVCIMPGMLKLFMSKTDVSTLKRMVVFLIDFLAIGMQCTVFGIVFLSKYLFKNNNNQGGLIDDSGVIQTTTINNIFGKSLRK